MTSAHRTETLSRCRRRGRDASLSRDSNMIRAANSADLILIISPGRIRTAGNRIALLRPKNRRKKAAPREIYL